jgi:hypothetical protein
LRSIFRSRIDRLENPVAKQKKYARRSTREDREYEQRLLKLILENTIGAQPRTRPAARVQVKVSDGRRAVQVQFIGAPPTAAKRYKRYWAPIDSPRFGDPSDARRRHLGEFGAD